MKKLTVEGLLLLRDIAQATAGNGALRHQVRLYLCERDVAGIDAFAYFCDTFSDDFVPFYTWHKLNDALKDCDADAAEELNRLNDEFMRTDAYERQVEIFNRLDQLREADR